MDSLVSVVVKKNFGAVSQDLLPQTWLKIRVVGDTVGHVNHEVFEVLIRLLHVVNPDIFRPVA